MLFVYLCFCVFLYLCIGRGGEVVMTVIHAICIFVFLRICVFAFSVFAGVAERW